MKKEIAILATFAAFVLVSCGSDDPAGEETKDVQVRITAGIDNTTASRVAGTAWTAGDAIGVSGTSGSVAYVNYRYTTDKADGNFSGDPIYFLNADAVTFTAYYPYSGTKGTAAGIIEGTTDLENQSAENQALIDYLWAQASGSKAYPEVEFSFAHKMSKLTITFQNGEGTDVSKITSYSLDGLVLDGTFDTSTGVAEANADATAGKLEIDLTGTTVNSGSNLPSLILYPQTISGTLSLSAVCDGQTYKCNLAFTGIELEAGTDYQVTITLNKTGLVVSKATIKPWTSVSGNGTAVLQ